MTTKSEVLHAIRSKCLDCSGYQPSEVRLCPVTRCALWQFRFGGDPSPAARGFKKSIVCTDDFSSGIAPGYGDTASPPSLEKSTACTDDFADGAPIPREPREIA
jgi:hypothetical protein